MVQILGTIMLRTCQALIKIFKMAFLKVLMGALLGRYATERTYI